MTHAFMIHAFHFVGQRMRWLSQILPALSRLFGNNLFGSNFFSWGRSPVRQLRDRRFLRLLTGLVLFGVAAYFSVACHGQITARAVAEGDAVGRSPNLAFTAPVVSGQSDGLTASAANPAANPAQSSLPAIQPPLSTRGNQIVDVRGRVVLLRGVNWFGLETEKQAPHGLWVRDYREMLAQIKGLGYNVIRLPYSVQALRAETVNGVDFTIGKNKDFEGKSPLRVMDVIIQEAQRQGLMILLDSHRLNNQRIPELWYGDGFTEADWIDTWKMLASRYRNQPNVIGADLKNEPHGQASWGTGDRATDWRLAAERAGNAILAVNPNWLIVVEGVEKNVPGQKLKIHWQGGNLEGVASFPVRLDQRRKLVYSPHEYGPGVFQQSWFKDKAFPQNLRDRWETSWHYIATRNLAPIYIGEFGGRLVDDASPEGRWQRQLTQFIQSQKLSFTYWSWNPNSGDTGGILQDDWQTLDQPKQALLAPLLSPLQGVAALAPTDQPQNRPQPVPTFSAIVPPRPTAVPPRDRPEPSPALPQPALRTETTIQSDWQTGFCMDLRVINPGSVGVKDWQLAFAMNQAEIDTSWNGTFTKQPTPQGAQYTVLPPAWARTLQPQQTISLGFCAKKLGADYQPKQIRPVLVSPGLRS